MNEYYICTLVIFLIQTSLTLTIIMLKIPPSSEATGGTRPSDLRLPSHGHPVHHFGRPFLPSPPHLINIVPPKWPRFREAPTFLNGDECLPFNGVSNSRSLRSSDKDDLCDPLSVHVAMTLDITYIRGSVAAIFSIVQHAACPESVVFHFVASAQEEELSKIIKLTFPYLRFKVYRFHTGVVKDRISPSVRQALEQPLNYARAYLAEILPACAKRVIYLDSDVVVVDDIARLWSKDLQGHPLGAPEYCRANFTTYFNEVFWTDRELRRVFQGRKPCYFNTGVMVMDLKMWRQWQYTEEIEEWMSVQRERRIYELGSLPPFLLVFAGKVKAVEHRWNQHGLGGDNYEGRCRGLHPGPVSLLHWSGKGKPWVRIHELVPCPLDILWVPYDLIVVPP